MRGNLAWADEQMAAQASDIDAMWQRMRARGWREDQASRFHTDVRRCLAQCLPLRSFDEHLSEPQRLCTNWYRASEPI